MRVRAEIVEIPSGQAFSKVSALRAQTGKERDLVTRFVAAGVLLQYVKVGVLRKRLS